MVGYEDSGNVVTASLGVLDGALDVESFLEGVAEAVLLIRLDGLIATLNSSAADLLGFSREELKGRRVAILLPERRSRRRILWNVLSSLRRQRSPEPARGLMIACKNGALRRVSVSLAFVHSKADSYVAATVRDASERKFCTHFSGIAGCPKEIATACNSELHLADEQLKLYCYAVSHELRAPLQIISGLGELLLSEPQDYPEQRGRYLGEIVRTTRRMNEIITDLLKLGQFQYAELQLTTIDMNELVHRIFNELRPHHGDRPVTFQASSLPAVRADQGLLTEVVVNLLSNALKFSGERAVIALNIGYQTNTKEVIFEFRDNGVGLAPGTAEKLFAPFQRLHSRNRFEGTGMGLAISRSIIERHGGRIWASGEPGEGATFCFSLPRFE